MLTTTEQLERLQTEILYHRKKAKSLRKRAEMQDRLADAKVKECAVMSTGALPLFQTSAYDPRTSVMPDGAVRVD